MYVWTVLSCTLPNIFVVHTWLNLKYYHLHLHMSMGLFTWSNLGVCLLCTCAMMSHTCLSRKYHNIVWSHTSMVRYYSKAWLLLKHIILGLPYHPQNPTSFLYWITSGTQLTGVYSCSIAGACSVSVMTGQPVLFIHQCLLALLGSLNCTQFLLLFPCCAIVAWLPFFGGASLAHNCWMALTWVKLWWVSCSAF